MGYVCSESLVNPGWSTVAKMKGIDVLGKNMCGGKFCIYVGVRYLKKISHLLTKLAKSSSIASVLCH